MTDRITYSQLLEKLNDPQTLPEDVQAYFRQVIDPSRPLSPRFEIDETMVDLTDVHAAPDGAEGFVTDFFVDFLNHYQMRRRQRAYERRIRRGWPGLRLVADGDSWFQYPLRRNDDLIDFLARPFAIYCLSAAGDELVDILNPENRERIADAVRNTEAHGFLFSAGGNDIAGDGFFDFLVDASPSDTAADYVAPALDAFLVTVKDLYSDFFTGLLARFPDLKVFYHGYDYALPQIDGDWLGPSLERKGIEQALWAPIVRVIIDRYNAALADLAGSFPGQVMHVSCLGAIGDLDQWRDELHGKSAGCERAADRFTTAITGVWPDALTGGGQPEAMAAGAPEAATGADAPPGSDDLSEEQRAEGAIIPDDDVGLEDALDAAPPSLVVAAAESLTEVPQVGWPNHDVNAPDYAHFETPPRGGNFTLTPADLELLIRANRFEPQGHEGTIVFGLRGAELTDGHQIEDAASIEMRDVRPNHLTFRCVMGFFDRNNGTLSAYTGSTVPNALSMTRYFKWQNGLGGESWANMLPTGCYAFRRASHGWDREREQWKVPVALRLTRPGTNGDGTATVLRTKNDLTYGTKDFWHTSVPTDNIHPAFSTTAFSSAGCLTVRGSSERFTNNGTAQWQRFLSRIQQIPLNGRIDLLLLTGAEAAVAGSMRAAGTAGDSAAVDAALGRLRVGSRGDQVTQLQTFLGITADGAFGPGTKASLTEKQKTVEPLDKADGVYAPQLDALFGINLFEAGTG